MTRLSKPDGGPAFPTDTEAFNAGLGGMSLRQHYAGEAMKGICSNGLWTTSIIMQTGEGGLLERIADLAATQADFLIARLNKETTKD